jgi:hypothetical protein
MYFYLFLDGKFQEEVYQNDLSVAGMFNSMSELRQKNWNRQGHMQILMSTKRFMNPVLSDLGVKNEMVA